MDRMAGHDMNRRQVETLIKAGAFDSLGVYRSRLISAHEKILEAAGSHTRQSIEGQLDLFSNMGLAITKPAYEYPDIPEYSPRELLMLEKECSGMYFTGHLLDGYSKHIEATNSIPLIQLADPEQNRSFSEKDRVTVSGLITAISVKNTKNDTRMAFITLEDKYGEIECIIFPKVYEKISYLIRLDAAIVVMGTISRKDEDEIKLLANGIVELEENSVYRGAIASAKTEKKEAPRETVKTNRVPKTVFLRVAAMDHPLAKKALNLVELFDAEQTVPSVQVRFYDGSTGTYTTHPTKMLWSDFIIGEFRQLLGEENVVLH